MTIYKYCRRCGRVLKGEENRLRGFGKICFEKSQAKAGRAPLWESLSEQVENSQIFENSQSQSQGQAPRAEQFQSTEQSKPRAEQVQSAEKISEQRAKAKLVKNSQRKKQGNPPHFKKALTPTYQKPLLFTPPTPPLSRQ